MDNTSRAYWPGGRSEGSAMSPEWHKGRQEDTMLRENAAVEASGHHRNPFPFYSRVPHRSVTSRHLSNAVSLAKSRLSHPAKGYGHIVLRSMALAPENPAQESPRTTKSDAELGVEEEVKASTNDDERASDIVPEPSSGEPAEEGEDDGASEMLEAFRSAQDTQSWRWEQHWVDIERCVLPDPRPTDPYLMLFMLVRSWHHCV